MSDHTNKAAIGLLDWIGCAMCAHSDPIEGGCDIDRATFMEKISLGVDMIWCGCFFHINDKKEMDKRQMKLFPHLDE